MTELANLKKEDLKRLFDNFYQYNDQVIQFRDYTNQVILVPQADPKSFKKIAGFFADNNHVYTQILSADSPPKSIQNHNGFSINNPDAKWEFIIIDGIDGKTFKYVKEKYDTVYWMDKNNIYYKVNNTLVPLANVDYKSFEYLDFLYAKDKNHIYYEGKILPIDVNDYSLNQWGFIKDKTNIYHYDFKIPLDPESFEVLYYNLIKQPIILQDKNGKYEYTRSTQADAKIIKQDN